MNENKTPAPKGVYNCAFVSASRSSKKNRATHFVLNVRLRPTDCGIPLDAVCDYFAELPLCYKTGSEYGFYNPEMRMNEVRKTTVKDTEAALEYARKCFPAWAEYIDNLPETANFADAFAWFDEAHEGLIVRAAIKDVRSYTGTDGMEHQSFDATIFESRPAGHIVEDADAFEDDFGKTLKAAGIKFGAKKPTASVAAPAVAKAPAIAPAPKKSEAATVATATRDEAWAAFYAKNATRGDDWCAQAFDNMCTATNKGEYKDDSPEFYGKCLAAFRKVAI